MRRIVGIAAMALALAFWGGTAVAGPTELSCNTAECKFNEEIGPKDEKHFHGHCDTGAQMTQDNSSMTCNANGESHLSCEKHAAWNTSHGTGYWGCTCTNHTTNDDKYPTIDLTCPTSN